MNTLIAYASKHGCTEKCAELLSKELNDKVEIVNLKNTKNIDISKYDKVIIGGSIYMGRIQNVVTEFCANNLDGLTEKPIGLYICGMQESETINTELDQSFPSGLISVAVAKECLGGEFIFDKMSFMEKMIVKMVSKVSSNKSSISKETIHKFSHAMNAV